MAETQKAAKVRRTWRKPRAAGKKACSVQGCKRPYRAKSFCFFHYAQWRRGELNADTKRWKRCSHPECKKPRVKGAYCQAHYDEQRGVVKAPEAAAPAAAPAAPAAT